MGPKTVEAGAESPISAQVNSHCHQCNNLTLVLQNVVEKFFFSNLSYRTINEKIFQLKRKLKLGDWENLEATNIGANNYGKAWQVTASLLKILIG